MVKTVSDTKSAVDSLIIRKRADQQLNEILPSDLRAVLNPLEQQKLQETLD